MNYSNEEIKEFEEILIESYGFQDQAQILDTAKGRFGDSTGNGVALLLRDVKHRALVDGHERKNSYYNSNPKERNLDSEIQRMFLVR